MKKIIGVLLVIQMLLSCVIVTTMLKTTAVNQLFYQQTTRIVLSTAEDSSIDATTVLDKITTIAEAFHIAISQYVQPNEAEVAVYTTDPRLNQRLQLTNGQDPANPQQFTSNRATNSSNQSGQFKLFESSTTFRVFPLQGATAIDGQGVYYLTTTDSEMVKQVVAALNKQIGPTTIMTGNDTRVLPTVQPLLLLLFCFGLFISVCLHQLVQTNQQVSVLRLYGYSRLQAVRYQLGELVGTALCAFAGALLIGLGTYVYYYKDAMLLRPVVILLTTFIILVAIIVLLLFFQQVFLKENQQAQALKGAKPLKRIISCYVFLQIMFASFFVVNVHALLTTSLEIADEQASLDKWQQTRNVYQTNTTYQGENDSYQQDLNTSIKLQQFYLANQAHGFIMDAGNYLLEDGEYLYEQNEQQNSLIEADGQSVTIDERYLKENPIIDEAGSRISSIEQQPNQRTLLVPAQLKSYEKVIKANFQADFYFKQVRIANIYNEELNLPLDETKQSDLDIAIIYVKDNQYYPTYTSDIGDKENRIHDPIAVIENGTSAANNFSHYLSSCYYFKAANDPYQLISPALKATDAGHIIVSVSSVYDQKGAYIQRLMQAQTQQQLLMLSLVVALCATMYTLAASYTEAMRQSQFIKAVFGYRMWQIHQPAIIGLLVFQAGVMSVLLTKHALPSLLIGSSYLILQWFIIWLTTARQVKQTGQGGSDR